MSKRKQPEEPYPKCEFAYIDDVTHINYKPHPYMIGPLHLSRNDSMYLGDVQIHEMEYKHGPMCYWKGKDGKRGTRCNLRYEDHTSDFVAAVKLNRDCTNEEMTEWLREICNPWCEAHGVDGYIFIDTGFRIKSGRRKYASR